MPNKILITGSNGLLGQKLVDLLRNDNRYELIATSRGANRIPDSEDVNYISLDITDQSYVDEVIDDVQPDYIIHTAAMTNVDECELNQEECWELNVTAVEYISEAAKRNSSFLIHLSTDFIFDGDAGPYKETDEPNPISYYGESKLAAEKYIQDNLTEYSIVRTVLVYGIVADMSRSNIVLWVKSNLEQGKSINVVTDQLRTPTLAEDLAKGCVLIADKNAEGVFHISGKDLLTPYDIAIATAEFFGLDKSLIKKANSSNFSQPAKRPPKTGFILDKAFSELGYNPVSFSKGIEIMSKQLVQ